MSVFVILSGIGGGIQLLQWLDERDNSVVATQHTYRVNESGTMELSAKVENVGGKTVELLSVYLTPVNAVCVTMSIDGTGEVETDDLVVGSACDGGMDFVGGTSVDPDGFLVANVKEADSESFMQAPAAYSATSRDLLPGELLWFEFEYALSPALEAEILNEDLQLDVSLDRLEELFGTVFVSGRNLTVRETSTRFVNNLDG